MNTARKFHYSMVRPVEGSVTHSHIYCLFDNVPRVLMARYLMNRYHMTPEEYREHCGLPDDYPMASPAYVAERYASTGK